MNIARPLEVIPEVEEVGSKERAAKLIEEDDEKLADYTAGRFKTVQRKEHTSEARELVEVFLEELCDFYK